MSYATTKPTLSSAEKCRHTTNIEYPARSNGKSSKTISTSGKSNWAITAYETSKALGLGESGGLRIGLAPCNNADDVDRLLSVLASTL
jgi:selenocysteine lyase/cysteine desulfurase